MHSCKPQGQIREGLGLLRRVWRAQSWGDTVMKAEVKSEPGAAEIWHGITVLFNPTQLELLLGAGEE